MTIGGRVRTLSQLSCRRLIRASSSRNDYPVILRGLKLSKCGSFFALSPGLCLHRGHLFEIIWFQRTELRREAWEKAERGQLS